LIHHPTRRRLLAATVLVAPMFAAPLGGCTVGPDFEHPAPWYNPTSWFQGRPPKVQSGPDVSEEVAEPVDPHWWHLFNDPQLMALEERLAAGNLDVRVQTIRLAESRASLGVAKADGLPQINGNAGYTREKQSRNGVISLLSGSGSPATGTNGAGGTQGGLPNSAILKPFDLFQYGFDASWEIDFWGRVRRNVESAAANVTASEESRRSTMVSAQAELARDYIQLRGTQRQIQITKDNLQSAQQSLALTQERAAGGLTTDLDVAQAAALVANTGAGLPSLQTQEAQLINAIALLLGQAPNTMTAELQSAKPVPPVPPRIPIGLPSELARRRPDIRQAEAQLHAATASIGVAVADFYPKFTIAGSGALQAIDGEKLADWASRSYSIGPSISLPIFEGGRLTRTLELRKAQEQEAAISYQRTVLGALHDVDNALTAYDSEQRRHQQLEQSVVQSRRALSLARDRYTQGIADFLSVLDAQRTLLLADQQLADSTTTISTNLVQIYKALGGGWEDTFPVPDPTAGSAPANEVRAGL
jgi:NodT family efflux transporter outer membrane factor (OMF) lipoprotein